MSLLDAKIKDQDSLNKAKSKNNPEASNWVASTLNVIGWIGIVLSLIGGSQFVSSGFSNAGSISAILGVVSSLFIIGFSEVIRLLHKIYLNTKK